MTRDQIGLEKVALQKALLYYESIHGRPVSPPPHVNKPVLTSRLSSPASRHPSGDYDLQCVSRQKKVGVFANIPLLTESMGFNL